MKAFVFWLAMVGTAVCAAVVLLFVLPVIGSHVEVVP